MEIGFQVASIQHVNTPVSSASYDCPGHSNPRLPVGTQEARPSWTTEHEFHRCKEKKLVKEYAQQLKQFIVTSRFNNRTWAENEQFRKNNHKFGCVYCAPTMITSFVPIDAPIFVLEMNNEINRIMGVGVVKNHPLMNGFSVYQNGNYNRYQYVGKNRIDRSEMTLDQEAIMRVFDILCFTGNKHQKRGHGLQLFPLNILYRCLKVRNLVQFLVECFSQKKLKVIT
jgi:hypothetical protein